MNTGARWERVRRLFRAAVEQPAEGRDAFLRAATDDVELRREVASLLSAHSAADGFLETPVIRREQPIEARPLALSPGDRVGAFEITALLGAGGMGEVYRAHDTQLGRAVAIKVLPPEFAADAVRLARFERESRVLAALNHPNIASIHSIEQIDSLRLLVLELVEGPTLADRLKSGSLPVSEALVVARQLAEALEAAHEHGIVHRDLKPSNVKVSASGRVVLLDFGLAKEPLALGREGAVSDAEPFTTAGVILGTCAYMSPEQARGQPVDKRTDIWAFGCLLFELLSGQRAFAGETPSDTIATLLEREPDWPVLPASLRANIRTLLRHCLEKDAHRRLHDIADARIEVEDALDPQRAPVVDGRPSRRIGPWLAAIGVIAAACIALGWSLRESLFTSAPKSQVIRFTWMLPAGMRLQSPAAVSPDGRHVAFAASLEGAPPRLYVRSLNAPDAAAIPRTEGAQHPFWSPDSQAVAYFARGKLMRIAIDARVPIEICAAPNPRGGAWGRSGVIVFAPGSIYAGLSRVSADGGTPEPATVLDTAQGENAHRWPVFLPDGVHFLYFVRSINADRRGVYLGQIDRAAAAPGVPLFRSESEAIYAPLEDDERGVLLSVADGHIDVHRFDARRMVVSGNPTSIALAAGGNTPHHASMLSASSSLLTHISSSVPYGDRLAVSTPGGQYRLLDTERNIINWPRVSPDGTRLVSQRLDAVTGSPDLWVDDLERGSRLRVTQEGASGQLPVWSPDGSRIAYVAGTFEKPTLTIAAADGTGAIATIGCPRFRCEPSDWSHDGRWLLVTALEGSTTDVWMVSSEPGIAPRPLLTESFAERDARFSADDQLVAYVSEEVGRPEVSVRTLGPSPRREVASIGGGTQPVWSHRGNELFFIDLDGRLQTATVRRSSDGRLRVNGPAAVDVPAIGTGHYGTQYALSPDGQRVYFLDRQPAESPRDIGILLGWRELLK